MAFSVPLVKKNYQLYKASDANPVGKFYPASSHRKRSKSMPVMMRTRSREKPMTGSSGPERRRATMGAMELKQYIHSRKLQQKTINESASAGNSQQVHNISEKGLSEKGRFQLIRPSIEAHHSRQNAVIQWERPRKRSLSDGHYDSCTNRRLEIIQEDNENDDDLTPSGDSKNSKNTGTKSQTEPSRGKEEEKDSLATFATSNGEKDPKKRRSFFQKKIFQRVMRPFLNNRRNGH